MLFEQTVWMELKSRGYEVFWFKESGECDFLLYDRGRIISCIQVCAELTAENQEREIFGLIQAMKKCECDEGIILTLRQFQDLKEENATIVVRPFWMYVLSESPLFG